MKEKGPDSRGTFLFSRRLVALFDDGLAARLFVLPLDYSRPT